MSRCVSCKTDAEQKVTFLGFQLGGLHQSSHIYLDNSLRQTRHFQSATLQHFFYHLSSKRAATRQPKALTGQKPFTFFLFQWPHRHQHVEFLEIPGHKDDVTSLHFLLAKYSKNNFSACNNGFLQFQEEE